MVELAWLVLNLAAFGVILCTIIGFLGKAWWLFDLFSHFRLQYLLLLAIFSLLFAVSGRFPEATLSGVFALVNLFLILPLYRKAPPCASGEPARRWLAVGDPGGGDGASLYRSNDNDHPKVRVLLANVLQRNRQYHRVRALIGATQPDIILFVEINETWVKELEPELVAYPHCLAALRDDNYGLGLFSKLPGDSFEKIVFCDEQYPSIVAAWPWTDSQLPLSALTHLRRSVPGWPGAGITN